MLSSFSLGRSNFGSRVYSAANVSKCLIYFTVSYDSGYKICKNSYILCFLFFRANDVEKTVTNGVLVVSNNCHCCSSISAWEYPFSLCHKIKQRHLYFGNFRVIRAEYYIKHLGLG